VTEKNVSNDEPTQEQIEHRINQIMEDSGFIMDFQVGLKLSQEEIDADEVRAHITESVYQHIVMLCFLSSTHVSRLIIGSTTA
jgi:hypothetical protein